MPETIEAQKEVILQKLKENGCRITHQRKMILDIILKHECTSCKEVFYLVAKENKKVGVATVYRMMNALEEIGAIHRKNMYRIECFEDDNGHEKCTVFLEKMGDQKEKLSANEWNKVIEAGLKTMGYTNTAVTIRLESSPL